MRGSMRDADAFDCTEFLGMARSARRDPYRLSLFAAHLEADERPLVLLPIHSGTLLVTDLRLLELRAHLEVHGAWNVKEFQGYAIERAVDRTAVREIVHDVQPRADAAGNRRVEDRLVVVTDQTREEFLVSRGPEPTLRESEFEALRSAVRGPQPK
jgi:hypothetical protein